MNINGLVTSYSVSENADYVDSVFYAIQNPKAPFLNLMAPGLEVNSTKCEWWEDVRLPSKSTLGAAHVKDSGTLTLASAKGVRVGTVMKVGDVLYRATDIVQATGVVAVVALNTDVDATIGTVATFLNSAALEGSGRQDSDYAQSVKRSNVTQIISDFVDVSGTQTAVNRLVGPDDLVDTQTAKKLNRIYLQLARSIFDNAMVDPEDEKTPRVFGGILDLVSRYGYAPAAAALSVANLDAFLIEMDQERGAIIDELWMNPNTLSKFVSLAPSEVQVTTDNASVIGYVPRVYNSKAGYSVSLKTDPNIVAGKILLGRPGDVALRPLATRQFYVKVIDDGTDAVRRKVIGEYTLEINPVSQFGLFTVTP